MTFFVSGEETKLLTFPIVKYFKCVIKTKKKGKKRTKKMTMYFHYFFSTLTLTGYPSSPDTFLKFPVFLR